jgi:2-amino-4-hydroxy-6-hydroxymethyldihydropteridine diphosphokinase
VLSLRLIKMTGRRLLIDGWTPILIALGTNLGFKGKRGAQLLDDAVRALGSVAPVWRVSGYWQTPAWPDPNDPPFVNAVVQLRGQGTPDAHLILRELQTLEAAFGRVRHHANAPRTLDLDLLAAGDLTIIEPLLELPHPRMMSRAFVLLPLRDVAPTFRHPVTGQSVDAALKSLAPSSCEGIGRLCDTPLQFR